MNTTVTTPSSSDTIGLPLSPVLERGLIVFAHTHESGKRIVTFEDPELHFAWQPSQSQLHRDGTMYVGHGQDVDSALKQALRTFHGINELNTGSHLYVPRPRYINVMMARLDEWLAVHTGTLRAVRDFDDFVIVRLEGVTNHEGNAPEAAVIESYGRTFFSALGYALTGGNERIRSVVQFHRVKVNTVIAEETFLAPVDTGINQTNRVIVVEKRERLS